MSHGRKNGGGAQGSAWVGSVGGVGGSGRRQGLGACLVALVESEENGDHDKGEDADVLRVVRVKKREGKSNNRGARWLGEKGENHQCKSGSALVLQQAPPFWASPLN